MTPIVRHRISPINSFSENNYRNGAHLAHLTPSRHGYTGTHGRECLHMGLLELLFAVVVGLIILSLIIEAVPSIVRLILICIALGLLIRFVAVVLRGV